MRVLPDEFAQLIPLFRCSHLPGQSGGGTHRAFSGTGLVQSDLSHHIHTLPECAKRAPEGVSFLPGTLVLDGYGYKQ